MIPGLKQIIDKNIELGFYDDEISEPHANEEIELADSYIKHPPDENIAYVGMEQFSGKYPKCKIEQLVLYMKHSQVAYMMIALTLSRDYPKEERMRWVKDFTMQQVILTLVWPPQLWQAYVILKDSFFRCLSGNR